MKIALWAVFLDVWESSLLAVPLPQSLHNNIECQNAYAQRNPFSLLGDMKRLLRTKGGAWPISAGTPYGDARSNHKLLPNGKGGLENETKCIK